jgi:hypothetical protein
MAIKVDRINGQNYAENIVDNLLLFDSGTWNIASGTGTATLDTNNVFAGDSSLKVQNNTPIAALTATNSVQSTIMPSTNKYHFSFYVKKDVALEVISGAVLVYRNAVLADTQSFTIGNGVSELDENDTWIRYQNDKIYSFDKGDDITFQFRIDSLVTTELTTKLYFDGVMMNLDKRNNTIVPLYNKPNLVVDSDTLKKLYNTLGWGFYVEDQSVASTQVITTTSSLLQIDGLGATSNSSYLPHGIRGVSELWDTVNNKIVPILLGDGYTVRVDLQITAKSGTPTEVVFELDIGGGATPSTVIVERLIGTGKTPPYTVSVGFPFFSLATFITNGGQIFLKTDTGTVTLTKRQISIHRISNGNL